MYYLELDCWELLNLIKIRIRTRHTRHKNPFQSNRSQTNYKAQTMSPFLQQHFTLKTTSTSYFFKLQSNYKHSKYLFLLTIITNLV